MDLIELRFDKKWRRKIGKFHSSLQGHWPGGNRYMRYSFYEQADQITMTIFSGRIGYWNSTYSEALGIEKIIEQRIRPKTTQTLPSWSQILPIERAHTQGILSSLFGGSNPSTSSTSGNSGISSLGISGET